MRAVEIFTWFSSGPVSWIRMRRSARLIILLATFSVAVSSWPSFAEDRDSKAPQPIAFVGELVDIKELNYDCGKDCASFDSGYKLEYRVVRELSGTVGQEVVSFDYFGHNGLTQFAFYPHALVFVYRLENENLMARYLAVPVWQTVDGKWGYCGDPYRAEVPKSDRKFHRLKFVSPVAFSDTAAKWRDDDYLWFVGKMQPGRTHCWHGALVEDMVSALLPLAEPGYWRTIGFVRESK